MCQHEHLGFINEQKEQRSWEEGINKQKVSYMGILQGDIQYRGEICTMKNYE